MGDTTTISNDEIIAALRSAIEKRLQKKFSTPRDFESLSQKFTEIGYQISASTLKRIWGYNRDVSTTYRPYRYTLVGSGRTAGLCRHRRFHSPFP